MEKSSDGGMMSGCGGDCVVEGLRAMARGLRIFADTITRHSRCTVMEDAGLPTAEVFDSWTEKMVAWRAALYVSSVVLRADLEVIGTSSNSESRDNTTTSGSTSSLLRPDRLLVGHL